MEDRQRRDLLADVELIELAAVPYMYHDSDKFWGSLTDFWNMWFLYQKTGMHQGVDDFVS